ncbi:MAG: hypothetical protein GY815_18275 [Gammaproteobacteria bacterium]|nr:hypothetical protein [Gammaproteobacteria bacterium]
MKNAAVLFLLAAIFFAMAQFLLSGLKVDSAEFPVHLQQGREYSADFQANWNVRYQIRLDSARNLDLQTQNCLLGIETVVPEQCAGISPELRLSWWAETGNTIVASGHSDDSNEGYRELKMGKIVGNFPALKGKTYRVRVRVEKSSPTLQQTDPHINIKIKSEDLKWTYVWAGILTQAAAFCFLLTLILLLIFVGRRIKARLSSSDS